MIDFLRVMFLESPVLLLIFSAIAVAVALAVHRRRLSAGSLRGVWLTVAACLLLLVLQHAIETDREQIRAAVAAMARAVDDGDIPTLGEHLDVHFEDRGLDKTAWLADVRQRLQRWRIDEARVWNFKIETDDATATVSFQALCDWRSGDQAPQSVASAWKLAMVRGEDGWKLQRVLSARFGLGGALDYTAIMQQY